MIDKNKPLRTLKDVKAFASYISGQLKLRFLPNQSFDHYYNAVTGEPMFSDEEIETLEHRRAEALTICDTEGVDVVDYLSGDMRVYNQIFG